MLSVCCSDDWQMLIDECLCHEVNNIRLKAAEALSPVCAEYYQNNKDKCFSIIKNYTEKLSSSDETTRIGYSLALGKPYNYLIVIKLYSR